MRAGSGISILTAAVTPCAAGESPGLTFSSLWLCPLLLSRHTAVSVPKTGLWPVPGEVLMKAGSPQQVGPGPVPACPLASSPVTVPLLTQLRTNQPYWASLDTPTRPHLGSLELLSLWLEVSSL